MSIDDRERRELRVRRDRQVFRIGELCDADVSAIAAAAPSAEAEAFNSELEGDQATVLTSAEEYSPLGRRDRVVLRAEEFAEEELAAIARSEAPAEAAAFDHEYEQEKE